MLGALEALESGTTAIVDHHESPYAIEGSLDVIADACREVGVRVVCAYGVTDRHGARWRDARAWPRTSGSCAAGGRGMVGVHAAFTCSDETLDAAAGLARDLGVGVHIHVAEGDVDSQRRASASRPSPTTRGCSCTPCTSMTTCPARSPTIPARTCTTPWATRVPAARANPIVLGTDGIGADMLDEFRVAFVRHREDDVTASPEVAWSWLENGWQLVPEARGDVVRWSYEAMEPWQLAYTTDVRAVDVEVEGEVVLRDGVATRVDAGEVRAKAAEQARRLHGLL